MDIWLQQYPWLDDVFIGFVALTWKHAVMWAVGAVLIWLAIKHNVEPALLLPIGFGAILANIPFSSAVSQVPGEEGFLWVLYQWGIASQLFPVLILIAIGTMCDFTPLIRRPLVMLFAAASQCGIFAAVVVAAFAGFSFEHAAAIGIIGTADGPTTIYVASRYARDLLGPLAVAAYSYMALVPIIQPPIIRALTTQSERRIKMSHESEKPVSRSAKILFSLLVVLIVGVVAPMSVALIGSLMFGNILKVAGCVDRLAGVAENELAKLVTLLLGISIGGTMEAGRFLTADVALIMILGAVAFVFDTAAGVLFARVVNLFTKKKINPMIGACGISAFPMSARVVAKMALQEDPSNAIDQHAMGVNIAGQVASVVAGGLVLALIPALMK